MSTRPFELACAGWTNTSANELRSQIVECSHIVEQYGGSDYQLAVLAKMYLRLNRLRIGDLVAAGDRLSAPVPCWAMCKKKVRDYEPYGLRHRGDNMDCSCGCVHFSKLPDKLCSDWGVRLNPKSHRAGLLMFEHQGCPAFELE